MRGKITGKEQGKCPVCVHSVQSCISSTRQRPLLLLADICITHGLHMVPQHDHRYGYFWLFDPHTQDEIAIGRLLYGAHVSTQVPLVSYNPHKNHWRPAPLCPDEDQKYLKHDYSRRLPPPTRMSAKHIKAWGLEPEEEVENWTLVFCDPSPDPAPSVQAGPSWPKRKAASPPRKQPARKRRIIGTTPRAPSPAPSSPVALREPAPAACFVLCTYWRPSAPPICPSSYNSSWSTSTSSSWHSPWGSLSRPLARGTTMFASCTQWANDLVSVCRWKRYRLLASRKLSSGKIRLWTPTIEKGRSLLDDPAQRKGRSHLQRSLRAAMMGPKILTRAKVTVKVEEKMGDTVD
jgi:hypothetical protein